MAEKIIDTRISLLYNTYDAWVAADPVLKRGEIAIVEIEAATDGVANASAVPTILFKAGALTGDKKFSELEWASAKAADVHDWAKKSDTDFIAWAAKKIVPKFSVEVTGEGNAITGASWDDVNGKLTLTKGETFATSAELSTALETAASDAKSKADKALEDANKYTDEKVQDAVTGGTAGLASEDYVDEAVKGVQDQIDALDNTYATDTQLADAVKVEKERAEGVESELSGKLTTLIGDDTGKSARTIANEELAAQLVPESAKESLDTLAEIAAWIQSHPDDASAMNEAITALQNQLNGIDAGTGTVKKYVDDAITALNIGNYALAADLVELAGRVTALEGKVDVEKVSTAIADAQKAAEDKAAELVNAHKESVDQTIADNTQAISDLDDSLAAIAKSGNINDLVQTEGDVLVLDCNAALFGSN